MNQITPYASKTENVRTEASSKRDSAIYNPYSENGSKLKVTLRGSSYDEALITHLKAKEVTKQQLRKYHIDKTSREMKKQIWNSRHEKIINKNSGNLGISQGRRSQLRK